MSVNTTTKADVVIDVPSAPIDKVVQSLLRDVSVLQQKVREVLSTSDRAAGQFSKSLQADIKAVERSLRAISAIQEKSAPDATKNAATRLKTQREINTLEVSAQKDLVALDQKRLASQHALNGAREKLKTASVTDQRVLQETVVTEQRRTREIEKQIALLNRQNAAGSGQGSSLFGKSGVGGVIARTAAYAAAGTAIFAVAGAATAAVGFTLEFEKALDKLGAISGSTATQMEGLKEVITGVGSQSIFSNIELTEAATILAQAGFSASGIASALQASSQLATASGSSMAEAVDVVTSAIGSFQLQETEAGRIGDALTTVLNRSKLTLQQVALGIQYAGATAFEQNISFEELTATMGALAQAGIRSGSTIGTGLRQFLVDLQSPSEKLSTTLRKLGLDFKDIDVATLGLPAVLENLAAAGFNSSEAYGSLETRAAAAYLVLKNNIPTIDKLRIAQAESGAASIAAAKAADNLGGQWSILKNRALAATEEGLAPFNDGLKDMIAGLNATPAGMEALTESFRNGEITATEYTIQLKALSQEHSASAAITDQHAAATEANATAVANATSAVEAQTAKLLAIETALERVVVRQGSLKDGSLALQAETATLANRFQGLASYLDSASASYGNLLSAMQAVRLEGLRDQKTNLQSLSLTSNTQLAASFNKAQDLSRNFANSSAYKGMKPEDQKIWADMVRDPNNAVLRARAYDLLRRQPAGSQTAVSGQAVLDAINSGIAARNTRNKADSEISTTNALLTPNGQKLSSRVQALSSPGTKPAVVTATIADITRAMAASKDPGATRALGLLLQQAQARQGSTGSLAPPKAVKATPAPKVEREPVFTRADSNAIFKDEYGLDPGSGYRSQRKQDSIVHPGKAKVSDHTIGLAQDYPLPKGSIVTKEKITLPDGTVITHAQMMQSLRNKGAPVKQLLFEKLTAPHIHASFLKNARRGKANNSEARQELSIDRIALQTATKELDFALDQMGKATSDEMFKAGEASAKLALEKWHAELKTVAQAEIDAKGYGGDQAKQRLAEVEDQYRAKLADFDNKIFEGFKKHLENVLKQIDAAFNAAIAPSLKALAVAEGARSALDREGVRGKVPDYVRVLADRRVGEAQDAADAAQIPALEQKASSLTAARDAQVKYGGALDAKAASLDPVKDREKILQLKVEASNLQLTVDDLNAKLTDTLAVSEALRASFEEPVTGTLTEELGKSVEAWRTANVSSLSFAQTLAQEVGPALDNVQGGLQTMFEGIFSGAQSAGEAFGNFAKGMLQYIEQIVAKLLASKLTDFLSGAIGISGGGGRGISGGGGGGIFGTPGYGDGLLNGGSVAKIKGYSTGGEVTNGFAHRDSVHAMLAKKEYVVKSSSVKSVGVDFMDRLNEGGSKALAGLGQVNMIQPSAKQETNVYVVQPEEKPSLGPNDILVVMHQDILKGGATKRLIKQVAQGG